MGSMFSKPSVPDPPPVPDPVPIPEIEDEAVAQTMRKRKGRSQTILTGDLVPPDVGQRTLLGG